MKIKKLLKRIIVYMLCLSFSGTAVVASAENESVHGDINGDGKILVEDAYEILSLASGIREATQADINIADMNVDGVISVDDVKLALEKAADVDISWTLKKAEQLNPQKNNGISEKASYAVVSESYAETFKETPVDDKSNPLYSAQPMGTIDYIKSGPASADGKKFYTLQSGRRVYADEVKVISGYELPVNEALLRLPTETTDSATRFYIDLNWRVPFNVTFTPQSYETGYDNRAHNVKDECFTARYMDITFYYTNVAEGALEFPDSRVIKNCVWTVNKIEKTARLRVYLRNEGEFYGYTAHYNDNNLLVISVKEPVDSLSGRVIEIDAGHGGEQPGAVSHSGVYEATITYKVALQLKSLLEKKGATVVLSRGNSSKEPAIEERRLNTMKNDPDLFVSIHLDSSSSTSVKGASVYYYKSYSAPLALAISKSLPKALKDGMSYTLNNRGMHYYPFCVIRVENCPAVLVECGFISNKTEFAMQNSAKGQENIAKGIYNGIIEYFAI